MAGARLSNHQGHEKEHCRGSIADPVSEFLEKPLDPRDGDLRLTLNYIHPASASESDFLFGRSFNGRSQKKRRKRTVVEVGQSLYLPFDYKLLGLQDLSLKRHVSLVSCL